MGSRGWGGGGGGYKTVGGGGGSALTLSDRGAQQNRYSLSGHRVC